MTFGGSYRGTGIRSANSFSFEPNSWNRGHFARATLEDEPDGSGGSVSPGAFGTPLWPSFT